MTEDDFVRALGLNPDSREYKLAGDLARADNELLEALVRVRKESGLSRAEVAGLMNRDVSAVDEFERLGADPHLSTIRRYAAAIGTLVTHVVTEHRGVRGPSGASLPAGDG